MLFPIRLHPCTLATTMATRVVGLWKGSLVQKNPKAAQSLADPTEYENLFPGLTDSFKTQQFLKKERETIVPASQFLSLPVRVSRLFILSPSVFLLWHLKFFFKFSLIFFYSYFLFNFFFFFGFIFGFYHYPHCHSHHPIRRTSTETW